MYPKLPLQKVMCILIELVEGHDELNRPKFSLRYCLAVHRMVPQVVGFRKVHGLA